MAVVCVGVQGIGSASRPWAEQESQGALTWSPLQEPPPFPTQTTQLKNGQKT